MGGKAVQVLRGGVALQFRATMFAETAQYGVCRKSLEPIRLIHLEGVSTAAARSWRRQPARYQRRDTGCFPVREVVSGPGFGGGSPMSPPCTSVSACWACQEHSKDDALRQQVAKGRLSVSQWVEAGPGLEWGGLGILG